MEDLAADESPSPFHPPDLVSLRVGVLTFHRPINYGSYWQARCLTEGLRTIGYEAEIIDHDTPASRAAERRISLRPTLPTSVPREDVPRYKAKIRSFEESHCHLPRSGATSLDRLHELEPYDAVVVGSDEVWNLRHPLFGSRVAFFGVGLPAPRVISYAASFGNYSCWEGLGVPWPELLSRFHAISVRDENSWWMLKHALNREMPLVLDPCLQFPVRPGGPSPICGSYVLVYGHNFSSGYSQRVRGWADRSGITLVSIGYRNDWAHEQWIEAGPLDFARAVIGAQGVATNFFHGCVFALAHKKPFATETSDYRAIKVHSLLEAVGGQSHLVTEGTSDEMLAELLTRQPATAIEDQIGRLREVSSRYLSEALR